MSDIFISYSRIDKSVAETIAGAFQTKRWSVWWDPHIPAGQTFDDAIDQALRDARCVVVLWSKYSICSHWVITEVTEGFNRNTLVPVFTEEVEELPIVFRRVQAADLIVWNGDIDDPRFNRLACFIETVLATPKNCQQPNGCNPPSSSHLRSSKSSIYRQGD